VQVTARLDAGSEAAEDQELEIWIDLDKIHVFDPESGENLTLGDAARPNGSEAETTVQQAVPAQAEDAEQPEPPEPRRETG
jgi:hypothetical protein